MASRIAKEQKAGRTPSTDIFIGSESHVSRIVKGKALETPNWQEFAPNIPAEAIAPGNVAVVIASRMPGVTYNTKLVPKSEVPRRLDDLLNSKWKGKIASTPYAASFDRAAMVVGDEKVTKFLKDLSRGNLAGLIRCGEDERIISGEFNMLALTCGGGAVEGLKAKGAPLEHRVLDDIPLVSYFYLGVPKGSAHPNMAKLFTVFMTTKVAQKYVWESEGYDMHMLQGTNMNQLVTGLRERGIQPRVFGVKEVLANQKTISSLRRKYQKILKGQ
ncbi:MAG: extracellular solute-binding protein [Deltaproteobacteria bacterium]|nr:extracellular solute-binding protein [Deltaproteobacteria bacterium]